MVTEFNAKETDNHRRLLIPVTPVPKQKPEERVQNWDESYLGYSLDMAVVEAERCIHCPAAPCQEACPTGNDVPRALLFLEKGDINGAAAVFRETSNLPDMCGRLCPQESLCEGSCVVGFAIRPAPYGKQPPVSIGKLESFIADYQRTHGGVPLPLVQPDTGRKAAVIGSGPAGLAVAEELRKQGHTVTVFESWPVPGGVLLYGIPNFKMRKEILQAKLDFLEKMGVEFKCNTKIGDDVTLDDLFRQGYDAIFLGTGAPIGGRMRIEGEELSNIYQATEFLVRGNLEPEILPAEHARAAGREGQARAGRGRRRYVDGLRAHGDPSRRDRCDVHVPPHGGRAEGPRGRAEARRRRGHAVHVPDDPLPLRRRGRGRGSGRVPQDAAWRAGRVQAAGDRRRSAARSSC